MAQFAEINTLNKVIRIVDADDNDVINNGGHQSEEAANYFKTIVKLSSPDNKWVESSYEGTFRYNGAIIGGSYDSSNNAFIAPKPYNSWSLDENYKWQAPITFPTIETVTVNDLSETLIVHWDEDNQKWSGFDGLNNVYDWNPNTSAWDIV